METVYDDESKEPKDTVLFSSPLPYGKVEKGTVVTLTVSSGVGDKHKVDIVVDLPSSVSDTLNMSVLIDGVVDQEQSKQVVPSLTGSVTVSLEGHGTSTVTVMLNDQIYREYSVDFATGSITPTASHEFVVPTTAPPEVPTEAPVTEAPVEEYTVDPNLVPTEDPNNVYTPDYNVVDDGGY